MKAINEDEKLQKVAYRIPPDICEKLKEIAIINRRSVNDEVITILQDYFDMPVKWEKWIEKKVKDIALEKGYTISWAVNYLVGTQLNKLDEAQNDGAQEKDDPQKASGQ